MAPGAAGFDVTTSGSASTYQWQLCTDANPSCVTWSDIAAAASASYLIGMDIWANPYTADTG